MKTKYKPKYATQLRNGLCADGKSVQEVCVIWGINQQTYKSWIDRWPNFADAADFAETQRAAYWQKLIRETANGTVDGNAGILKSVMPSMGWVSKVEQQIVPQEKVSSLIINVLPSYEERKALMDERNTIEGEIVDESFRDQSDGSAE